MAATPTPPPTRAHASAPKQPTGKQVLICVGGSIAAYKACDLVSKLVQAGHGVDVVMTEAAQHFVRPLSFAALTHRPVFTDGAWFEGSGGARTPADHLHATENADLVVVAPCTANLIAKFAHGLADDIVSTTLLGAHGPRLLAPAMNFRMWENKRVRANMHTLREDGFHVVGPETGYLAEAETGIGRMSEPARILEAIERILD
jgi:phosphopantothenoylcysteine decarboxylase/phosphopantothenate--cysteine ligase